MSKGTSTPWVLAPTIKIVRHKKEERRNKKLTSFHQNSLPELFMNFYRDIIGIFKWNLGFKKIFVPSQHHKHTHEHHLRFPSFHHLRISSQIPLLIHSLEKFLQQQKKINFILLREEKKWLATSHNNQQTYNSKILRNFYSFRASFVSWTIFFSS